MTTPITFQANIAGDNTLETIVFDTEKHTATVDGIPTTVKVLDNGALEIFAPFNGGNKTLTLAADGASAVLNETIYGACYKTDFGLPEGRYENNLPTPRQHAAPVTIYPSN